MGRLIIDENGRNYIDDNGVWQSINDDNIIDMNLLKQYLRIDGDEEDKFLGQLAFVAEEYLAVSCSIPPNYNIFLYSMAVTMLINHWYENRGLIGKVEGQIQHSLNSLLMQLRYGGVMNEIY